MTVDNAIAALADFLQPLMPTGTQIVRAQVNRVPLPEPPCIVMTELLLVDLSTVRHAMDAGNSQMTYTTPKRLDIQLDFYDGQAAEMCNIAKTMLRSDYARDSFPDGLAPLYCSDGVQAPLITGEQQYESRWTITASLQYNAGVTVAQEFFDTPGSSVAAPADITTVPLE